MTTLVISAPWSKKDKAGNSIGKPGQSGAWETFFKTGVGLGYMLYPHEVARLRQGIIIGSSKVVLLRNDYQKKRAEARLTDLKDTNCPAGKGGWRYDICFQDQKEVPYVYHLPDEELKWNGVKVY